MTDRTSRAVAPVSAVCAAFAAQPSAYPPEASKPHVAPTCGSVAGTPSTEKERLRATLDAAAARQEKTLALFCARLTASARSAGSFEG